MNPEVQAAIINVAGLWSIEVAKGLRTPQKDLGDSLIVNFESIYIKLLGIVKKLPDPS